MITILRGALAGYGYTPPGGTTGQSLVKLSNDDGDSAWSYGLVLTDGSSAPPAIAGLAQLYVDSDGKLKLVAGDGTIKTFVTEE